MDSLVDQTKKKVRKYTLLTLLCVFKQTRLGTALD